jgi:hypothetical protein
LDFHRGGKAAMIAATTDDAFGNHGDAKDFQNARRGLGDEGVRVLDPFVVAVVARPAEKYP